MAKRISLSLGRRAFGNNPDAYDMARPEYPDWIFEEIDRLCPIRGCVAFEIGAGTRRASRTLLTRGAERLVAIEPNTALAAKLRQLAHPRLQVLESTFEAAELG